MIRDLLLAWPLGIALFVFLARRQVLLAHRFDRTSHRRSDGPGAIPVRGEVNHDHAASNAANLDAHHG